MKELYLDNSSTTKVYPEVVKVMNDYFDKSYGNPSSSHSFGEVALNAINSARVSLAKSLNAKASNIIFTSGASESNNLALFGLARAYPNKKKIIISSIEHASIKEPACILAKEGYDLVELPVDSLGFVDIDFLEKELSKDTLLVSIMHANNVIGSVQNLKVIGEMCRKKGVLFHTDAVQSFCKLKIDVKNMNVDLLSASAHKIGGPKGVGLLYVREGIKIEPIIYGGGQERGFRSGTENVSGIVGFAKAAEITNKIKWNDLIKIKLILISGLKDIDGKVNSPMENALPNIVHVSFSGHDAETMVSRLSHKGIYLSTGSACESRGDKEDYVLKAIGLSKREILGSLRISLSSNFKSADCLRLISELKKIINL